MAIEEREEWYRHICERGTGLCAAAMYWVITEHPKSVDPSKYVDPVTGKFDHIGYIDYVLDQYAAHKAAKKAPKKELLEEKNWQDYVDMDAMNAYCKEKGLAITMPALQWFNEATPDDLITSDLIVDDKFDHVKFIDRVVERYLAIHEDP